MFIHVSDDQARLGKSQDGDMATKLILVEGRLMMDCVGTKLSFPSAVARQSSTTAG